MVLSKSFGYALRGILYVSMCSENGKRVQVDEIAEKLSVPRHFLGKIMNRLAKEGLLDSIKGPYGGFSSNKKTLSVPLMKLVDITEGLEQFTTCVLRLKQCDATKPCPLHYQIKRNRKQLMEILSGTFVADLLKMDKNTLVKSIAADPLQSL